MILVDSFSGEYRFLSNFYPCAVTFDDFIYPSTEHAFQAAKTLDLNERSVIRLADTPGKAKRLGREVSLRPGWDLLRVGVMYGLLRQKFGEDHWDLANRLDMTGNAYLVEGNTWGDTFWGVCGGEGKNILGRLLMVVREENRLGRA